MWQQDTTVVDSALQEAIVDTVRVAVVDTIYVAVGGGWETAAPIIASIVAAAMAVAIVYFAWATRRRDTNDREERTRATDTKVSVRGHWIQGNLNAWTTAFPSGDDAFEWAMKFRKNANLRREIRRLVGGIERAEQSAPASRARPRTQVHHQGLEPEGGCYAGVRMPGGGAGRRSNGRCRLNRVTSRSL